MNARTIVLSMHWVFDYGLKVCLFIYHKPLLPKDYVAVSNLKVLLLRDLLVWQASSADGSLMLATDRRQTKSTAHDESQRPQKLE